METLLQEEGLNLDFPKQGEIRTGVIASIGDNEILVSVGTKSEGVISGKEKESIPPEILASIANWSGNPRICTKPGGSKRKFSPLV